MDSTKDPLEILENAVLHVGQSAIAANKAFSAFCELDFAAIYQHMADALEKPVDELTDNEKRQAVMDAVLSDGE